MAFKIDVSSTSPFTLDNIPFGVISTGSNSKARCATALGDYAIDLAAYWKDREFAGLEGNRTLYDIFNQVCITIQGNSGRKPKKKDGQADF